MSSREIWLKVSGPNADEFYIELYGGKEWSAHMDEVLRLLVQATKDPDSTVEAVRWTDPKTGERRTATRFKRGDMRW